MDAMAIERDRRIPEQHHGARRNGFDPLGLWRGLAANKPGRSRLAVNDVLLFRYAQHAILKVIVLDDGEQKLACAPFFFRHVGDGGNPLARNPRSEEHTSELQSLMRIS